MNLNKACKILNIDMQNINETIIKKQYRINALKYHPDKNKDENATEKFHEINEAYHYLLESIKSGENKKKNNYDDLFNDFLSSVWCTNNIRIIIQNIVFDYQNLSLKLFEKIDSDEAIELFKFINNYHEILHISPKLVERIKDIINKKNKSSNIFILNPSLYDLLEDNIYVLNHGNENYYIPLWHNELHYKHNEEVLIIKNIPELPNNMCIDNNNNLFINKYYSIQELLDNEIIVEKICNKIFKINVKELNISKKQTYCIKNEGISKIQYNNIYNNTVKGDIYFNIFLS
jgi:hypothetical protein